MSKTLFPGYRYGPDGERELFEHEADVPEGWHRNSPEGLAKLEPDEPIGGDVDKMTRPELEALALSKDIDLDAIPGTGKDGALLVDDIRKAIEEAR